PSSWTARVSFSPFYEPPRRPSRRGLFWSAPPSRCLSGLEQRLGFLPDHPFEVAGTNEQEPDQDPGGGDHAAPDERGLKAVRQRVGQRSAGRNGIVRLRGGDR